MSDLVLCFVNLVSVFIPPVKVLSLRVLSVSTYFSFFLFYFESPCPVFTIFSFASPLSRYVRSGAALSQSCCVFPCYPQCVCCVSFPLFVVVLSVWPVSGSGISCLIFPGVHVWVSGFMPWGLMSSHFQISRIQVLVVFPV